jgi:Tol biopolymer transport system component
MKALLIRVHFRRLLVFSCLFQSLMANAALNPSIHLVSAAAAGLMPSSSGGGDSYAPVISPDGRYVLFASTANNLVALPTNQPLPTLIPAPLNVFLRDRSSQTTMLISINATATGGGNGDSLPIGVSTNGRYALFESTASNLVPGDTAHVSQVFVRDLLTRTTVLVSAATNGSAANSDAYNSVMTPDGRFVAFASAADNLVAGDTNGIPDVFVRDLAQSLTTLVSIGAVAPINALGSPGSGSPLLTPDGRYVAFYSTASNLVAGVNTVGNIYLRDRLGGITTLASAGALAALKDLAPVTNAVSFNLALSQDGRFIAFESVAFPDGSPAVMLRFDAQTGHTDLIDTNPAVPMASSYDRVQDVAMTPDGRWVSYVANAIDNSGITTAIRVWDAQSGTNVLASGNSANSVFDGSSSDYPVMSEDGRWVAFLSSASDLVTNSLLGDYHCYLHDLKAGTTTLVDVGTNGVGSALDLLAGPVISADGRFVGFSTGDPNIVPADRNRASNVFLRDAPSGNTELISVHDPGLPGVTANGSSSVSAACASTDGRFVTFFSEADDLVTNDLNGVRDIFVRDLTSGSTTLVSVGLNGLAANGLSTEPAISANGRFVAFSSFATNLVNGDTGLFEDVFVRDLQAGTTFLVSQNSSLTGSGDRDSYSPLISSNGQFILFRSKASNLAPGLTAGIENLFWRDMRAATNLALTVNGLWSASMTPDGSLVAYVGNSSKVAAGADQLQVWNSGTRTLLYSLTTTGTHFGPVAISGDGRTLVYLLNVSGAQQIWVSDLTSKTNRLIVNQVIGTPDLHLSSDGRFLAYLSASAPLAGTPAQVYLYDLQLGTNWLLTRSYDGMSAGNGDSDSVGISPDGRFVCYRSAASNLVPDDMNNVPDVFVYDRLSGGTTLASASQYGHFSADNRSLSPVFTPDSRTLLFTSWASDLLPDDFNQSADVFSLSLLDPCVMPGFALSALAVTGAVPGTQLTWPAMSGKAYRVQFKSSLNVSEWTDLAIPISIVNGQASAQDSAAIGERFYRVVAYQAAP